MTNPSPTRARIRAEALKLFVAHGVAEVSVRDIARAVGMSAPNLYAHYAGRDALVADLFRTGYADYGQRLTAARDSAEGFAAQLAAMVRLICRLYDEDEAQFRFLLLNQHAHLNRIAPDAPDNPIDILHQTIAAAMDRGELPPGDAALRTAAVVGIVVQAATFRLYGRLGSGLGALAEEIIILCRKVLA